ncbi:hypothetical protein EPO04_01490 [Patescibacteria group bacterium]|nr:MAG: hypothetical protein EPO04_01490 [Patescibacteria group bacterium]
MKGHEPGSAEYVLLHGMWQRSRGRNPSLPYMGVKNPQLAFEYAEDDLEWRYFCRSLEVKLYRDGAPVARVLLDHLYQVSAVIMLPGTTGQQHLWALRRIASHTQRYWVSRYHTCGPLHRSRIGRSSHWLSLRTLNTYVPNPVFNCMSVGMLAEALEQLQIEVVFAAVNSLEAALLVALDHPKIQEIGITHSLSGRWSYDWLQLVTFEIGDSERSFRLWHGLFKPGGGLDLSIVPGYHPVMSRDKISVGLINGHTSALIRGMAVQAVLPPEGSLRDDEDDQSLRGWTNVNHPFYAAGSSITVHASRTRCLSLEGIAEIQRLVLAVCELDDLYLSVSGGFDGPYRYPEVVAEKAGLRVNSGFGSRVRGSEGRCVWAHQVLSSEGEIESAYVPDWFYNERWLEAYRATGALRA